MFGINLNPRFVLYVNVHSSSAIADTYITLIVGALCVFVSLAVVVGFEETARTVPESTGNIFIPVTLRQPISDPVTVSIVFVDGSATERSGMTTVEPPNSGYV